MWQEALIALGEQAIPLVVKWLSDKFGCDCVQATLDQIKAEKAALKVASDLEMQREFPNG